jgi:predicted nucleic acid-binding protein
MSVLVDSSVWIDYFRDRGSTADILDLLIEENLVIVNDLILAELVPFLSIRKEKRLIALLQNLERRPLIIDWENIIHLQIVCLNNGISGIGIPDLIIAQNAIGCGSRLLSNDKHFGLISKHSSLELYH